VEVKNNANISPSYYRIYSIRYRAALTLYLLGCSIVDIMLQGRWSSDVFMVYIKCSVLERSTRLSGKMLVHNTLINLPSWANITLLYRSSQFLSFGSQNINFLITASAFHLHHQIVVCRGDQ